MMATPRHIPAAILSLSVLAVLVFALPSCDDTVGPPASYAPGNRMLGGLWMEDTVYHPRITWWGGYVSILGVNAGYAANLDSTLVWCVQLDEDDIRFPVTYGTVPPGASDITTAVGGSKLDLLAEDMPYTFWVMKRDAWALVQANPGKVLSVDSTAPAAGRVSNDSVLMSPFSFVTLLDTTDRYINIREVDPRGRLADLSILETDTSNRATVWFTIKQPGVTDSLVAAMGLVENSAVYSVNNVLWEVLSVDSTSGSPLYRTLNVMGSPILLGQEYYDTRTFFALPGDQLKRNRTYYFWIAAREWDGETRDTRVAIYYAWMVFKTW